jgi:hypothetical protein
VAARSNRTGLPLAAALARSGRLRPPGQDQPGQQAVPGGSGVRSHKDYLAVIRGHAAVRAPSQRALRREFPGNRGGGGLASKGRFPQVRELSGVGLQLVCSLWGFIPPEAVAPLVSQ